MIQEITGDIFLQHADVLVNPVNCVGVMGGGLALQFKNNFPEYFQDYKKQCKNRQLKLGTVTMDVWRNPFNPPEFVHIASFPTKYHYSESSTLASIYSGMGDLATWIGPLGFTEPKVVAIPRLGCGLGGLDWKDVKPIIVDALEGVQHEILLVSDN